MYTDKVQNTNLQERFEKFNSHPFDVYDYFPELVEENAVPIQIILGILDLNELSISQIEVLNVTNIIESNFKHHIQCKIPSNNKVIIIGLTMGMCGHYYQITKNINPSFRATIEKVNDLKKYLVKRDQEIAEAKSLAGGYCEFSFDSNVAKRNKELMEYVITFTKFQKIMSRRGNGVVLHNLIDNYCKIMLHLTTLSKSKIIYLLGKTLYDLKLIDTENELYKFVVNTQKNLQRFHTDFNKVVCYNEILEKIENPC
jgi:hypothetical protein